MKRAAVYLLMFLCSFACAYGQRTLLSGLTEDTTIDGTEELYCENSANTVASMCKLSEIFNDLGGTCIEDADADTSVCVEESADDDYIYFRPGGSESYILFDGVTAGLNTNRYIVKPAAVNIADFVGGTTDSFLGTDTAGGLSSFGAFYWLMEDKTSGSVDGSFAIMPATAGSTSGTNSTTFRGGSLFTTGMLGAGGEQASAAACISNSSDRLYHDTDCDGTKDSGEEYIDQAGSSSGSYLLNAKTSTTSIASSTTETTVYSYTIPGGTVGASDALRLSLKSVYLNNSGGSRTVRFRVKLGGSTVIDYTSDAAGTSSNPRLFPTEIWLNALGATNSQIVTLEQTWMGTSALGTLTTGTGSGRATVNGIHLHSGNLSVDMTSNATLEFTIELGFSHASHTWDTYAGVLEHLR